MKIAFVLADTYRTYVAHVYENEHMPYRRRVVMISLTPEQEAAIAPQVVGMDSGVEKHEEIIECFISHE